ncbi:MAG: hypothetical protein AABX28_01590 [Nanoarchaeota archaeon]
MKKKNGEVTTQQIVLIIILIASFLVILFFLFRLDIGNESKDELCRNSVVMKGNSALPKESVSLNCRRSYDCITADGSCEGLTKPDNVLNVNSLNEVYATLSEEMVGCWRMFGEGEIDYIGTDASKHNYCSICNQLLFDDSLKTLQGVESGEVSKDGLYAYLAENKIPDKEITYLQYLTGKNNLIEVKNEIKKQTGAESFGTINVGEQFFVVMGITSRINYYGWVGGGAGVGGLAVRILVMSNPVGLIGGAIVFGIAGAAGAGIGELREPKIGALNVNGKGIDNKFMLPTIIKANSDEFKALNCEEVLTFS